MDRMQQQAANTARTEGDAHAAARQSARARAARADAGERRAILTRTVEADVIPELLALHRGPDLAKPEPAPAVRPEHVAHLVNLVLAQDESAVLAFVGALHEQGAPHEVLCLDLLAPAARRLGEMWETDDCDFAEVSIGSWRLHAAMRALARAQGASGPLTTGARVLLMPLPGEQHTFGLSMVHDFFARAGWDAWTGAVADSAALHQMVRDQWVAVLGFSLASDEKLDALRAEIVRVRAASRNQDLLVMVGGPGFSADPALAEAVGADGTATDGLQAVQAAARLVANGKQRR